MRECDPLSIVVVVQDQAAKEKALAGLSSMSSAQIVSASLLQNTATARSLFGSPGIVGNAVPMHTMLNSPSGGPVQPGNPVVVKHEILNPAGVVRQAPSQAWVTCVPVTPPTVDHVRLIGNNTHSTLFDFCSSCGHMLGPLDTPSSQGLWLPLVMASPPSPPCRETSPCTSWVHRRPPPLFRETTTLHW